MASRPDETDNGDEEQEIVPIDDDRQYELAKLTAEQRERKELAIRALKISQQEIQRHYDFLSEQLKVQDEQNKRAHRLVRLILGGFGFALCLPLYLLLYIVFYGNEAQAGNAMKMLTEGAKALGSAGFIFLIYSGLKRLINR